MIQKKLLIVIHLIGLLPIQFMIYGSLVLAENPYDIFDIFGLAAILHRNLIIPNLIIILAAWIIFLDKKILKHKYKIIFFVLMIVIQISVLLTIKPYGFL